MSNLLSIVNPGFNKKQKLISEKYLISFQLFVKHQVTIQDFEEL